VRDGDPYAFAGHPLYGPHQLGPIAGTQLGLAPSGGTSNESGQRR
jgi:hypothetical protein